MGPPNNAARRIRGRKILTLLEQEYQNGDPRDNVTDALTDLRHTLGGQSSTLACTCRAYTFAWRGGQGMDAEIFESVKALSAGRWRVYTPSDAGVYHFAGFETPLFAR